MIILRVALLLSSVTILFCFNFISIYLLIILFIFFTILCTIFSIYKLSYVGVNFIFTSIYFIIILICLFVGTDIIFYNKTFILNLGYYIKLSEYYQLFFILVFDKVSISFILLIALITGIVLVFIKDYFKYEAEANKFTLLIILFSVSMMLLVSVSNLLLFFFFWELIGLTSFFLINFYHLKPNVFKAALKAFCFNKLSDCFILIGSISLIREGVDMIGFTLSETIYNNSINYGLYFICFGASIKSSQLFFHFWLPDSMEAPVPASALIHSATLVSAGIYIIIRVNKYLFIMTYFYSFLYIWFSFTALFGGVVAMYQVDIKRLLAYSTISHCGFLLVTALFGDLYLTLCYLYLHGIYKAVSFIIAGKIINQLETQDLRLMTQLYPRLPNETIIFILSVGNLAALPGTLGLYYKSLYLTSFLIKNVEWITLSINFLGCLTGVGYFTHLIKIFFTSEIRHPKNLIFKKKISILSLSDFFYLFIFIVIILTFILFIYLFNNLIFLENIKTHNTYIFKLFFTLISCYIFIFCSLDIWNFNKNLYIYLYLFLLIICFLIYWK